MLSVRPAFAWHAMANAALRGKPFSAALAFVKMIVPRRPAGSGACCSMRRAAC